MSISVDISLDIDLVLSYLSVDIQQSQSGREHEGLP